MPFEKYQLIDIANQSFTCLSLMLWMSCLVLTLLLRVRHLISPRWLEEMYSLRVATDHGPQHPMNVIHDNEAE